MRKLFLNLFFIFTSFLMASTNCPEYSCSVDVDSVGNPINFVNETTSVYESTQIVETSQSEGEPLPTNHDEVSACALTHYTRNTYSYSIVNIKDNDDGYGSTYQTHDVSRLKKEVVRFCYASDDRLHVNDNGTLRDVESSDCSNIEYFSDGTCEQSDCPADYLPNDDYATSFQCHPINGTDSSDSNDSSTGDNSTDSSNSDDTDTGSNTDSTDNTGSNSDDTSTGSNTDSTGNTGSNSNDTTKNTNNQIDYRNFLSDIRSEIESRGVDTSLSVREMHEMAGSGFKDTKQSLNDINETLRDSNITLGDINSTLADVNSTLGEMNTTLGEMLDFMRSELESKFVEDSMVDAESKALSTISSITGSLNSIISSYTGTAPIITGTGNHVFTASIYNGSVTFDLSMFEDLRPSFDIFWLLLLAYLNFKIYSIVIRDLLKKI